MSFDVEKLYALLPVVYRLRDIERGQQVLTPQDRQLLAQLKAELASLPADGDKAGEVRALIDTKERGPLKALLAVIAEQVAVLEEDLDQLYDDLFIETCAEWVVPYIGDLVGARGIFVFPDAQFSQRAQVANTLSYRRRKGTAAVLEQLARDATGWNANVVEYFQRLATTQYMNHIRPENLAVTSVRQRHFAGLRERLSEEAWADANVRQWQALEFVNSPFDTFAHTADVRHIDTRRGKYNIPNVGVHLWRLGSYSLTAAPAYVVPDVGNVSIDGRRYLFNAIGKDTPLYNDPQTEAQITHLAEPINVPMPLSRRRLDHDLEDYYGVGKSILLNIDGEDVTGAETSPPRPLRERIRICDLSDDSGGTGWAHHPQDTIAIDPVLGRIAFPINHPPPARVYVTYHYGFSAAMGGGEYGRGTTFSRLTTVVKVAKNDPAVTSLQTVAAALGELASRFATDPQADGGVIEITDNEYYGETPGITAPAAKHIELRAADEQRPVVVLSGEMLIGGGDNAEVTLNGLLISGGTVRVPRSQANKLRVLRLRHCTLLPGPSPEIGSVPAQPTMPRLVIEAPNVRVEIDRCIVGAIRVTDEAQVQVTNSIVDATAPTAVAYAGLTHGAAGGPLEVQNSTVIGKVHTLLMELASNTIFLAGLTAFDPWIAPVLAERLQEGCVRFSYVPPGARLPRQYRCQPQTAGDAARVRPMFTSLRYGDAGYCQLSRHCAAEIRQGADDEAEMGAFHDLYQPQREANLRARLDEYLRFGLEAGVFYAS